MEQIQNFIVQNAAIIFPLVSVWSMVWKGFALWKAARKEAKVWFVVLLIVNTVGILEILYIYVLHKVDFNKIGDKVKNLFRKK